MKIAIGSDHAGYAYKSMLKEYLLQEGHEVKDFGTFSEEAVDYPLYIRPVAVAVSRGEYERGIVLGGSGNGEAMTANRIKGVRCALCWNAESAIMARKHNDANMISLGQRMISKDNALEIVRLWLETPFEGGRHIPRIRLLDADIPQPEATFTLKHEKTPDDKDDYVVVISFGYILYKEGRNTVELKVEPRLKGPTLIHVPSSENWNKAMPGWLENRRDEIIDRIARRCKHMIYEFKEF
ncbi:MAG: ribose 5-phosphate isomerase B [Deltaproteobacteria bacterium]|nr:ribose 5-phosphate isomerase B [Deltaproteobacteria bacterium]